MARNKFKVNATLTTLNKKPAIRYTCPKCGLEQTHYWFGREKHYCTDCEYATELLGEIKKYPKN